MLHRDASLGSCRNNHYTTPALTIYYIATSRHPADQFMRNFMSLSLNGVQKASLDNAGTFTLLGVVYHSSAPIASHTLNSMFVSLVCSGTFMLKYQHRISVKVAHVK